MSRRTVVLLLWAVSFGYERPLIATLLVSGDVSYTTFDEAGTGQRLTTRSFDATIDGCRWRIRTSQLGTNGPRWGDSPYVYMEIANGADSLFVTRLWKTPKLSPRDAPFMEKSVTVSWGKTPYLDGDQFA